VDDNREGSWSQCCEALALLGCQGSWSQSCQVLPCLVATVGGGTFSGDEKPPDLDIYWSVDHLDTCGPGTGSP
jgi:hypothetical protein